MDWGYQVDVDPDKDWAMFQECKKLTGDGVPLSFDANNGYPLRPSSRGSSKAWDHHFRRTGDG